MSTPSSNVPQVARLSASQIAQFKRDGFVVLPGVIDPDLCRQARDQMWDTIAEHRPSMQRDDPSSWGPFTDEEQAGYQRPEAGGDPYFAGRNHRMTIRNGAEDLLLDIGARALWDIAEQLMGEGEVVWPAGLDASGTTSGPCPMTEDSVKTMQTHLGPESETWTGKATGKTEELRLPKTGPVWLNAQGTRGMYCTLPNSSPPGPQHVHAHAKAQPGPQYPGAHSCEGLYDSRWRVQTAVYFDDLPPGAGGLHLWPRSHTRIWDARAAMHSGEWPINPDWYSTRSASKDKLDGYVTPPVIDIKADTPPVDTHGPVGSVVLWHSIMLHMAGINTSSDVIRQATLYAFAKTPESVPDERAMGNPAGDIWQDWSDEVQAVAV